MTARGSIQSRAHAADLAYHDRYLANRTPLDRALDDVEGAIYFMHPARDPDLEFAHQSLLLLQREGGTLSEGDALEIAAAVEGGLEKRR